jgi:hypothetical protein
VTCDLFQNCALHCKKYRTGQSNVQCERQGDLQCAEQSVVQWVDWVLDSGQDSKWANTQSGGPVHLSIFCSISIFLLASLVTGRRPQCSAGAD